MRGRESPAAGDEDDVLYRLCPLCRQFVDIERWHIRQRVCRDCHAARRQANTCDPYTEGRKDYLRRLSVPELRAYAQGLLHGRMQEGGVEDELRLICDRLEWVADSLIVAGVEGWNATYGGLRSTQPPHPVADSGGKRA